jgi:two-component system OmpR family sensor kinase
MPRNTATSENSAAREQAGVAVRHRSNWYRSFYWRIGISFVVFVLVVIVAQSVMFSYLFARANMQNTARSPNNLATTVAGDLRSALSRDPGLNLGSYLSAHYGREPWRVFVVMRSGEVAGNSAENLSDEIKRSAELALVQTDVESDETRPRLPGPVVTAPVQIGNELRGLVVLPPPPPGGVLRDVGRLLSLPGTLFLIAATVAAAAVIFGPARRRLSALEDAAGRLGNGDLSARARQEGDDEIGRVARAFNRMADELAVRDEALQTSDRLRRQMLADVSHELKTPLTAMRGFIETLRMPEVVLDEERRARYLETVERETRRLERIVEDLLDLARYENGVSALDIRVFDVGRVFQHVAARHEQEAQERGVSVRFDVAEPADQVMADPGRIEQVIENLFANALRHTPHGGTIELRAKVGPGVSILSVSDSGEGIDPEHIVHVFERFYKVDPSRTADSAGSGLGLSIAKAIIDGHGGEIRVGSRPGCTTFTIVLPQLSGVSAVDGPRTRTRGRQAPLHSTSTNL